MPGTWEMALIFLVVLLVFGAKRIPEIARGLGKGIREFKDATSDIKRELTVEEHQARIQPPRQSTAPRHDPYREPGQDQPPAPPAQPTRADNPSATEPRD